MKREVSPFCWENLQGLRRVTAVRLFFVTTATGPTEPHFQQEAEDRGLLGHPESFYFMFTHFTENVPVKD